MLTHYWVSLIKGLFAPCQIWPLAPVKSHKFVSSHRECRSVQEWQDFLLIINYHKLPHMQFAYSLSPLCLHSLTPRSTFYKSAKQQVATVLTRRLKKYWGKKMWVLCFRSHLIHWLQFRKTTWKFVDTPHRVWSIHTELLVKRTYWALITFLPTS